MHEHGREYFLCTYGRFERDKNFLRNSVNDNTYKLHKGANYPSALNLIKKGDVVLLQNYCWIVAYGIAKSPVEHNGADGWIHVLTVEEWKSFDKDRLDSGVHSYGIRWSTEVGGSMSVVKKVNLSWAQEKLRQFPDWPKTSSYQHPETSEQTCREISCQERSLSVVISYDLRVPSYQRGYCWRQDNIVGMLEDIKHWREKHPSGSLPYHLGTIIAKQVPLEEDKSGIDIIDGQQRLLTLALILDSLGETSKILESPCEGTRNASKIYIGYLVRAKNTIDQWIKENIESQNINKDEFLDWVKKTILFCFVLLPANVSEDLAYTFFNATNATGKRLSDYDLLKTHHLRYLRAADAGYIASRWNKLARKDGELNEILHLLLYRLRSWNSAHPNNFSINADKTASRALFRHYSVKVEPLTDIYDLPVTARIDSTLSGGIEFFNYVEYYRTKFITFSQLSGRDHLTPLSVHSNGVLYGAIKAVLFMYYCKFGERYINEALFCIAYRLSSVRNEHRVMRSHLQTQPIFSETVQILDKATLASEFLAWLIDPKQRYKPNLTGITRNRYWQALRDLLDNLRSDNFFALKSHVSGMTGVFNLTGSKNV